jgi:cephalosporin hydroxylase
MLDVIRAFRIARGAKVYLEVGSQDKGNIAWLMRTALMPGATIIDVDMLAYPENEMRIRNEAERLGFDYHLVRGDCLSDETVDAVKNILGGRAVDIAFCDSHYTYTHTLAEFSIYYPLLRQGGFLLFHDAMWPGRPGASGEEGKKGKGLAVQQLDRFHPAWMVVGPDTPLFRSLPPAEAEGFWGTLAIFPS